jgi:Fe-Mn family superoxide dismutase
VQRHNRNPRRRITHAPARRAPLSPPVRPDAGLEPAGTFCKVASLNADASHFCGNITMTFTLPELPYAYDALAPHMSKETLEYHHDKHHQAYVTNGNNLLKGTEFEGKSLEDIVKGSFGKNAPLFNNAGQHYNHLHFWKWMKPNGGGTKLPGRLEKKITEDLGGLEKFKTDFAAAGVGQFGSGWAWLSVKDGKLEISKTANGENPLVHGATPILGVDVWEHSYYIDYRNRRPDYLKAFVDHLVNWDYVDELFSKV